MAKPRSVAAADRALASSVTDCCTKSASWDVSRSIGFMRRSFQRCLSQSSQSGSSIHRCMDRVPERLLRSSDDLAHSRLRHLLIKTIAHVGEVFRVVEIHAGSIRPLTLEFNVFPQQLTTRFCCIVKTGPGASP